MTPDERVLCARSYDDALGLPGLHLEIVTQGWVGPGGPDADDPAAAGSDLCSHGDIRLVIGGETIARGDDGEYGISEAPLGLLRTITSNRRRSPVERPLLAEAVAAKEP
jgi:hypothetical protein